MQSTLSLTFSPGLVRVLSIRNISSFGQLSKICGTDKTVGNKAGYTATDVACRWAGAIFEVARPFGQEQWGQRNKIIKKSKVWPTDQPTNRPTDKAGCRVACTWLKSFFETECVSHEWFNGRPARPSQIVFLPNFPSQTTYKIEYIKKQWIKMEYIERQSKRFVRFPRMN